jgi:hypothetical protein
MPSTQTGFKTQFFSKPGNGTSSLVVFSLGQTLYTLLCVVLRFKNSQLNLYLTLSASFGSQTPARFSCLFQLLHLFMTESYNKVKTGETNRKGKKIEVLIMSTIWEGIRAPCNKNVRISHTPFLGTIDLWADKSVFASSKVIQSFEYEGLGSCLKVTMQTCVS